jgi:protein SCO1/2
MLCTLVLNGLVRSLLDMPINVGEKFNVVTISFDPRETPALAAAKKKTYLERYGRPGAAAGWHFLTGEEASIKALTEAVGFHYTYDPKLDQFAHASGIMVLTPKGKLSRYFYGIEFSSEELHQSIDKASEGKVGSVVQQILFYCFHYDPETGKYGPVVMRLMRLAGVATLLVLGTYFTLVWRRERRKARQTLVPT